MSFCLPRTEPSFVQNQIMFFISLMELLENSFWKPGPYLWCCLSFGADIEAQAQYKTSERRQISDSFSPGLPARTLECHLNIDYLSDNAITFNGGHCSGVTQFK